MLGLKFNGTWRNYQKQVLDKFQEYQADGHVHLVAAPGSGKTTIGIELIARFDKPALVLVPTVTIREQWVDRIRQAFLEDENQVTNLVSQNLKDMKQITIATYQAFHSAMQQVQSQEDNGEVEDYVGFDLLARLKERGVETLCLDECHHLRNEWWKSLEDFRKNYQQLQVISLTATPPYDSEPELWDRYLQMCGEIDQEITVPELVKEDTLCPHQDFVYICFPTKEEDKRLEEFEDTKWQYVSQLVVDPDFQELIRTSKVLKGENSADMLLEDPKYLSALLIYLQAQKQEIPKHLRDLLGAKGLPALNYYWLEVLLQGLLYQTPDWYEDPQETKKKIEAELKSRGLIEKRQVFLVKSKANDQILNQSLGKLSGIADIFATEYASLGKDLRQLVLADYIRKDFANYLGDDQAPITQLGVLPYFETIRRSAQKQGLSVPIAVLSGSVVIIPASVKAELEALIPNTSLTFSTIGKLDQGTYLQVGFPSNFKGMVAAVTELFQRGSIQVLVGTKSLLGEGWDAPCVNSLILGSFVGSFMLSNQMRGRAIRIWPGHPEKTSNIWHLVAIKPYTKNLFLREKENEEEVDQDNSYQDLLNLTRRMEHFLGLSYKEDTIETGLDRLNFPKAPFKKSKIKAYNQKIKELSKDRSSLRKKWQEALVVADKLEIVNEVATDRKQIPLLTLVDAEKWVRYSFLLIAVNLLLYLFKTNGIRLAWLTTISLVLLTIALVRYFFYKSPYVRLRQVGEGIRNAMLKMGHLSDDQSRVQVEEDKDSYCIFAYLKGGSMRDKELFSQTLGEFFTPVDNQRYLLVAKKAPAGQSKYFVVPSLFEKRKEEAQLFLDAVAPQLGDYQLVYTRNEAGRKVLLEARLKSLANKNDRIITKKKVKSALK
ncbi:DEAD/DEAH box helicase family protein [Streptococcus sp. BJSWXB6CM1]|uniref:DEAD/DEAH box helicase family protein n=1 Tax=Streptococcus fermentans TaxID=3095082 RepID=A0ABU5FY10_9STRE|nr:MULTISPECIES: DEAD/DEAH box helicase family protein [unclassified Streptococcus]MDY4346475.1 DEAD/DEAH box helicase family protein [Streptococcus sp. BJSWXB5TM5]MDY4361478.1 DEAD/DEAH box helicase family protein [Streptococcus sp. BJSWXB3CM3]MDY4371637.1 DEAD/DEAH box helicase family protein [Streptococcus sp. BJSWXB6CM1]